MDYVSKKTKDGKTIQVKDYKKKIKKKKRKRKVFVFLLLLTALICFLIFAPVFKISDVVCEGNSVTSSEEIIEASGINFDKSIFAVSLKSMENKINQIPYVESCNVERRIPNGLKITITQCKTAAYVKNGKNFNYIDKNLKLLEQNAKKPKAVVPEIVSAKVKENVLGDKIVFVDNDISEYLEEILKQISKGKLRLKVTKIDFKDKNNVKMTIEDSLVVNLGANEKIDYKINFIVEKAYDKLGEKPKGTLDVSSGTRGVYKENKE